MSGKMKIRARAENGVTSVRALITHPMETGRRKDSAGNLIPAHFITEFTAKHGDKVVLSMQMGPSVSTNPYVAFSFNGGAKGEMVELSWVDNTGDSRSDSTSIG